MAMQCKMKEIIFWNLSVSMNRKAFHSLNIPLAVVSFLMDIFYIFCMRSPVPEQQRMKRPLFVLLGFLVGCNTALHFFTFLFLLSDFEDVLSKSIGLVLTAQCLLFTMRASITSSLWLNLFYYCQIVPAQHPFFILLKRNISLLIFSALILDKLIFLDGFIVNVASYVIYKNISSTHIHNSTCTDIIGYALITDMCFRFVYFLFSLCLMLASGCATISYLRRHMKIMKKNSRSSARLQSQMRVTITGIVQTLLYFLCSVWLMLDDVAFYFTTAKLDSEAYIICTVIALYSFGTNINLGVGQAVFREQVILIWQKCWHQRLSMT